MILSRPETATAFAQLIAALDSEAKDLNELGTKVALAGETRNAAKLMKLAAERGRFREHIASLFEQWKKVEPDNLAHVTAGPRPGDRLEILQSKPTPLSRKIKGLTVAEAARKLMVKPALIQQWIGNGKLTAYQRVSGTWKILPADLIACYQKHRREV